MGNFLREKGGASGKRPPENVSSEELPLGNEQIAAPLEEVAKLLESQGANPFRVRAYLGAAQVLRRLEKPAHILLKAEGLQGLMRFPGIGQSLARTIERLAFSGRLGLLDRLRGENEPERLLTTVGGIGPKTAHRIYEKLGIETLEELETAAYDSRLSRVEGMGRKRIRAIRESLAGRFRRWPRIPEAILAPPPKDQPSVEELLSVDQEYHQRACHLPRIAPRRFNPTGEAWLPVLHTHRQNRHYTALYSNTARAHELGTTRDWVVIYRDDHGGDGQWTVVSARLGSLRGNRIVRGREPECKQYYDKQPAQGTLFSHNK